MAIKRRSYFKNPMKIIIFGASGDLSKRKLFPALSSVYSKSTKVIGYARSGLTHTFSKELRKLYDYKTDFPEQVEYIQGDYSDLKLLENIITPDTVLYFSVPPKIHNVLLMNLSDYKFYSIEIEKPFGVDLESFNEITKHLHRNIHFIDHYLLKSLVVAIPVLYRNDKRLFELLSKHTVKQINCHFLESILSEAREYFDKAGIIKDVMQNHLIEILAAILSDKTTDERSSKARAKFIKKIEIPKQDFYFGQYDSYQKDLGRESNCETFAAFMCRCSDPKWTDVPIMMIAGKGLDRKATEIIFDLKVTSLGIFKNKIPNYSILKNTIVSSKLVFSIAPVNEIFLEIFVQGKSSKIILYDSSYIDAIKMKRFGDNEEYQIVFDSLLKKAYFPSVSPEEAHELWRIFDRINNSKKYLNYYPSGSPIPSEAILYLDSIKDDNNK